MLINDVLPKLGDVATLMALPPVILLPVSYLAFKEKVGWQAIVGTLLAIAGVAILFLA
jgi:drug/metabolite transporter (DMT)-like permease